MNWRKLRENIKFGCELPVGWYVFIFPDGSRSHELTGTNYPTSNIIITAHGGENIKEAYIRAKEQLVEMEYRGEL
jgi:hypothetical protein